MTSPERIEGALELRHAAGLVSGRAASAENHPSAYIRGVAAGRRDLSDHLTHAERSGFNLGYSAGYCEGRKERVDRFNRLTRWIVYAAAALLAADGALMWWLT